MVLGGSRWLVGVIIVAAAVALYAAFETTRSPPATAVNARLDVGRRLYAEHCAACHGGNLEGQQNWRTRRADGKLPAPPHDASGHTWHHSDQVLFEITRKGQAAYPAQYATDMPAFADRLADQDIAAIFDFIRSTWPPEIRERQQRLNALKTP